MQGLVNLREFPLLGLFQASALGQNLNFCNFFSLSSLWKELLSRKKGLETTLPFAKYNILLRWMWDELCCGGVLREFWRNRDYRMTLRLRTPNEALFHRNPKILVCSPWYDSQILEQDWKGPKYICSTIDVKNKILWLSNFWREPIFEHGMCF